MKYLKYYYYGWAMCSVPYHFGAGDGKDYGYSLTEDIDNKYSCDSGGNGSGDGRPISDGCSWGDGCCYDHEGAFPYVYGLGCWPLHGWGNGKGNGVGDGTGYLIEYASKYAEYR